MAFHFETKLSRIALLAYAVSLWEKGDIPFKLKQFYYPYGRRGSMKFLQQLIHEVIQTIDPLLPVNLYDELVIVVRDVAYKRYDWFNFLRRKKIFRDLARRQLYDRYLTDVYWTPYGMIDEVRILKESWLKMPKVDLAKMYVLACSYGDEDLINEIWEKMSKKQFNIPYKDLCKRDGFHLVVYWNKLREHKLEDVVSDCIVPFTQGQGDKVYDVNQSIEVNMLRTSAYKGYVSSVKYFWGKLDDAEKVSNIEYCLTLVLKQYANETDKELCRRDQFAQIAFFLLKFLSEPLKKKIFTFYDISFIDEREYTHLQYLGQICIDSWPWYDFFTPFFNEFKDILNGSVYKFLLREVADHRASFQFNFSQSLLFRIWNKIPSDWVFSAADYVLPSLFKCWDLSSMKLILSNKNLNARRADMLKKFYKKLLSMLREGEIDKVIEFVLKILISETWEENVQKVVKSIYLQTLKGEKINLAQEVKEISYEEVENVKSNLNHEIIVYFFMIKDKLEDADEFLMWKFEDTEKVDEFKSDLEKNQFVRDHIRSLWKTTKENVKLAKINSERFLLWFLMDDNKVRMYKLREIVMRLIEVWRLDMLDEGRLWELYKYSSWSDFLCTENIEIWNDFISWIQLDDKLVDHFKSLFRDDRLSNELPELVKTGHFEEANKLCKWVFGSEEEEMFNLMRKVLLSDSGRAAWRVFISKYSYPYSIFKPRPTEALVPKFEEFINFWRKPFQTFDSLKEELNDWFDSNETYHEMIDDGDATSDDCYSDDSDDEDFENLIYCRKDDYECIMNVLNKAENVDL